MWASTKCYVYVSVSKTCYMVFCLWTKNDVERINQLYLVEVGFRSKLLLRNKFMGIIINPALFPDRKSVV